LAPVALFDRGPKWPARRRPIAGTPVQLTRTVNRRPAGTGLAPERNGRPEIAANRRRRRLQPAACSCVIATRMRSWAPHCSWFGRPPPSPILIAGSGRPSSPSAGRPSRLEFVVASLGWCSPPADLMIDAESRAAPATMPFFRPPLAISHRWPFRHLTWRRRRLSQGLPAGRPNLPVRAIDTMGASKSHNCRPIHRALL
jgi:hypothetical protein